MKELVLKRIRFQKELAGVLWEQVVEMAGSFEQLIEGLSGILKSEWTITRKFVTGTALNLVFPEPKPEKLFWYNIGSFMYRILSENEF